MTDRSQRPGPARAQEQQAPQQQPEARRPYTRLAREGVSVGGSLCEHTYAYLLLGLEHRRRARWRGFQKLTSSVQRERAPQRRCYPFQRRRLGDNDEDRPAARRVSSKGLTKVGVVGHCLAQLQDVVTWDKQWAQAEQPNHLAQQGSEQGWHLSCRPLARRFSCDRNGRTLP